MTLLGTDDPDQPRRLSSRRLQLGLIVLRLYSAESKISGPRLESVVNALECL